MFFSERKKLAEQYEKWISENKNILDCPLTVISWLVGEGYLGKTKIADLETKLADTETQNKRVLEKLDLIVMANQELEKENDLMAKTLRMTKCIEKEINQDKIEFAVEQLNKINKHIFNEGVKRNKHYGEITSFVCDLIKEIKEME